MKRHDALVQLSRDHHFGLLLCWKLKEGLKKEIAPERMANYIRLFYQHNLAPHFDEEEQTIFKILGEQHPLISEAISQHREMEDRVKSKLNNAQEIEAFRNLLELHIRTEERQIFPEIEKQATEEQLQLLLTLEHPQLKEPAYDDIFWK